MTEFATMGYCGQTKPPWVHVDNSQYLWSVLNSNLFSFLVACYATLHPALSVGLSVGRSHFTFFMIFILWPYCSCPIGLVTSNMAPAHPHATWVAVYPALFFWARDKVTWQGQINDKDYVNKRFEWMNEYQCEKAKVTGRKKRRNRQFCEVCVTDRPSDRPTKGLTWT